MKPFYHARTIIITQNKYSLKYVLKNAGLQVTAIQRWLWSGLMPLPVHAFLSFVLAVPSLFPILYLTCLYSSSKTSHYQGPHQIRLKPSALVSCIAL